MFIAYVVVTILTAAANIYAAISDFRHVEWIVVNMDKLHVPTSWLSPLGVLKAAGGLGLLVGLALPSVGIAAAIGLVLYFLGAMVFTLRARWYSHLPYPFVWLLLAAASLVLRLKV